eukprot:CAMPEP_0115508132 /NCGR_PEP_ID=MMETSP0271-20121206/72137_1 /TAXON_ID=71861 /ORGANISM="Scrippsiella trochoidea, Strain CCMP3099" /LENGTH=298 /DNA_ID=CAMNT_0002937851 /DNA_START=44 /DNA_END=936 /DNA_ORIENTATION=-
MLASDGIAETLFVMLHSSLSLAMGALLIRGGINAGGIDASLCQRRRSGASLKNEVSEASLPDCMWPVALAFAGLPSAYRLGLCSKGMHRQWGSADFWWQLMQNMGLNPMDIMSNRGVFSFAVAASQWKLDNAAALFRDRLRRRVLIDEGLLGITMSAPPTSPPKDSPLRGHKAQRAGLLNQRGTQVWPCLVRSEKLGLQGQKSGIEALRLARRAIFALQREDGDKLLSRASTAIMAVLRWRGGSEEEACEAEAILDAVATRTNLFSTSQMLDILGAHQAAEADLFTGSLDKNDEGPLL